MRKFFKYLHNDQKGAVNIAGVMMLSISMVFLAVGFIFLPITTSATTSLSTYEYSANTTINAAYFTGYTAIVNITPLLILVGFLTAAVVSGMLGVKVMKGSSSSRADPGSLMLLGLSIVFIGIGLIIEPVALDGIASVCSKSEALASFTGYVAILKMSPMLVHLGFLAAAVLSGFFGLKRLSGGGGD